MLNEEHFNAIAAEDGHPRAEFRPASSERGGISCDFPFDLCAGECHTLGCVCKR